MSTSNPSGTFLWRALLIWFANETFWGNPCAKNSFDKWSFALGEGSRNKKVKKKLTSVSFMYVCVAENAELLVFFYFFLHLPHRQFSFRREVLNHHTPPPIPKLSSITKTRILFVFLPKKVPVFCLYFYKNEPVWRIRHTALSDFSLNPSIRQLLIHFSKFSTYAWGQKVKVLVFRECMYVWRQN